VTPATTAATPPPNAPKPVEGPVTGGKIAPPTPTTVASSLPPQRPRNVIASLLESQQIYHPEPQLPAVIHSQRRGTDPRFIGRVCVNNEGKVFSVNVLSGIPGADEEIVKTIRQWTYKPQAMAVCFVANIVFDLQ
jgi:hypothetical protein